MPSGVAILLTDTVGFIEKLPTQLVAAFRATLEELAEADLLLQVVDVSHPSAIEQSRIRGGDSSGSEKSKINHGSFLLNKVDRLCQEGE